ncbi:hypothetical protein M8C13_08805 [Crossiella sp. SN42]|uniref:hypothetical protein n=1 Tax=Crossiella sp. SN42 TaxID=2944808 RepID=UPI00207D3E65|nr:hypothetical protein [Crossiella sp. SN42]MCO1575855.1 hypothetical protein [Crossiella sp. SN42]
MTALVSTIMSLSACGDPAAVPDQYAAAPYSIGEPDYQACVHPRSSQPCRPWARPQQRPLITAEPYFAQLSEHRAPWGAVYACDALGGANLAPLMTDGKLDLSAFHKATRGSECRVFGTDHPARPVLYARFGAGPWDISPQERAAGGSCWSCPTAGIPGATVEVVEIAGRKVAFKHHPLNDSVAVVDMVIQIPHMGDAVWMVEYTINDYLEPQSRKNFDIRPVLPDLARARQVTEALAPALIAYDHKTAT